MRGSCSELGFQTNLPSPARRGSRSRPPLRRPRPSGTPTRRHALGRLPTPPPLPENLLSDCTENCPLRPCEHPGRFPFTYRFAARAPCDSQGSQCQCGIHRAEAASALRSRKTERAAKEKPTPISHIFLSTCCAWHPNSPPRPGEAPHPAPSARKSVIRLHRKLPSAPPASTQEVSESENRPATRGTAHSEVQGDDRGTARCTTRCSARCSDRPMAALHFLLPTGDSR